MRRDTALRSLALACAMAPLLAGCVSFGPKPPKNLLALTPAAAVQPGPARTTDSAHAIALPLPQVPQALATQRVMVRATGNTIAYLPDAAWVAAPAALFRDLLAETITARTGRFVPGYRQSQIQPDTRLSGQLVDFGLDASGSAAVVTFDGVVQKSGRETLQARRFTARVPVAKEDPVTVGAAINQAAAQVAADIADWVGAG